ncbi:MAG: chloride channel protein [Victivallales bacterium]|nr:chloride channel protein [Victivallales bacterium]
MNKLFLHYYRYYFLRWLAWCYSRIGERCFFIIVGILVGIISGLAAVAMKRLVHTLRPLAGTMTSHSLGWLVVLLPLFGVTISYLIQRLIVGKGKYDKSLSNLILTLGLNKPALPFYKVFSHILTSGFAVGLGGSAGLEAPIVLTGAAIGSNSAKIFRINKQQQQLLVGCGAAAGISAIFNSPVAGVLFVAEILLPEFSVSSLIPVLLASATSAVVARMLHTEQLFLLVSASWDMTAIPFYFGLGLICSLVGVWMIRASYWMSRKIREILKYDWQRLLIGGTVLSLMIYLLPPLFGEGYGAITKLFDGDLPGVFNHPSLFPIGNGHSGTVIALLFAAAMLKVFATTLTVGSGGDGGIFAPSMFAGAFIGYLFAYLVNLSGLVVLNPPNFIAAGMCGVFTAVMRAPMTGIFLIAEVTGGYILFIPLMIVSALSFFVARRFEPYSVYTKVLAEQNLLLSENQDKAILQRIRVQAIIEYDYPCLSKDDPFRRLVQIITETPKTIFPVLDDHGVLIGVVDIDKVRAILLNNDMYDLLLAFDIMDEPTGVLSPSDTLAVAMANFELFHVEALPVVKPDGRFLGFISKAGVFAKYRGSIQQKTTF